eukprot:3462364-Amphidinium_carterae.1
MAEMAAKQDEEMEALRLQEEQKRDEQAEEMAAGLQRRVEQKLLLQHFSSWVRVVAKDAAKHKLEEMEAKKAEEMEALKLQEQQQRDVQADQIAEGLKRRVEAKLVHQHFSSWVLVGMFARFKKNEEQALAKKQQEMEEMLEREEARIEYKVRDSLVLETTHGAGQDRLDSETSSFEYTIRANDPIAA